jgi:hypothetical protein
MALIGVSVIVFVGEPLLPRKSPTHSSDDTDQPLAQLALQKEVLYTAIRDLDFDYHTGKVDQQDYTTLRQHFESEALQLLRQLDETDPLAVLDSDLERQILSFRHPRSSPSSAVPLFCPECRAELQGSENFCPSCGQSLLLG